MKNIFLATLLYLSLCASAQNIFGDFTALDFTSRHATQLTSLTTYTNTQTKKPQTDTNFVAIYNPKTKLISIMNYYEGKPGDVDFLHYVLTDSLNELITVNADGKPDTITYPPTKPKYLKNNVVKMGDEFRFYNKQHQLVRTMIDTTQIQLHNFSESNFQYQNNLLVKRSFNTYINTLFMSGFKYDRAHPVYTEETTFSKYQENTLIKERDEKTNQLTETNVITTIEPKKRIKKEYSGKQLISTTIEEFN